MTIATYGYTYGAGNQPNRHVVFYTTPVGNIQADVYNLNHGIGSTPISTIFGDQISVEMESLSQKLENVSKARALGQSYSDYERPHCVLGDLAHHRQVKILKQLKPNGLKILEMTGDVEAIKIVDVS